MRFLPADSEAGYAHAPLYSANFNHALIFVQRSGESWATTAHAWLLPDSAYRRCSALKLIPRSFGQGCPRHSASHERDFLEFVRKPAMAALASEKNFRGRIVSQNWAISAGTNAPANVPVTHISCRGQSVCAAEGQTIADRGRVGIRRRQPDARTANDAGFKRQVFEWYSTPATVKLLRRFWSLKFLGVRLAGIVWEWVADFNTDGHRRRAAAPGSTASFCGSGSQGEDVQNYPAFMRYGFRSSLGQTIASITSASLRQGFMNRQNIQMPGSSSREAPNSKLQLCGIQFWILVLELLWSLDVGAWSFYSGLCDSIVGYATKLSCCSA